MRYLTVLADYHGTGIKDDFVGAIEPISLGLPLPVVRQITKWLADYQFIIAADDAERLRQKDAIERLDKVGVAIAQSVKAHLGESAKVQYYSEGVFRRLPL